MWPADLKNVIWRRIKVYIRDQVKPVIVAMAEYKGHTSLWSTPYHSDLQLIVIVWANMSREQWAGSTKNTTFNDVKVRLDHAFATLDSKTVTGWMHQESKQDIMIFVGPCNADGGD